MLYTKTVQMSNGIAVPRTTFFATIEDIKKAAKEGRVVKADKSGNNLKVVSGTKVSRRTFHSS
ncbi:MAG: hypothetical protein Q3M24_19925 [Candidatus Electrothrix aestuarii]|uniref:Uncharacterized protein n=1 Tax=Candidatus Electrothrix aestuarii TaxID=3062594 RepID=A0AAU8LU43_9BACT|nr:hypothetical protein [Candidatus Electrothrix aestuarii]